MENENKGNENKIILGDFNFTMDNMDSDRGNETQRFYRCHSNNTQSKLIVDNGLEDLWRRKKTDSSELIRFERSSGTISRTDMVCTSIVIAINTKIIGIMISFSDHYNAIFIDRLPYKTKFGKD